MGDSYRDDYRTPCFLCRHPVAIHNLMHGCSLCKCAATKVEARRWPDEIIQTPAPYPRGQYLHVWQDPTLPADASTSCNVLSAVGRPSKVIARCYREHRHREGHLYIEYEPGSPRNPTTPDTEHRKGAVMPKKLSEIERELLRLEDEADVLAARRAELLRQKEERLALPSEPHPDAVIKFTIQHDPHGVVYTVHAFRSRRPGAQWYTTHSRYNGPYTWEDLLSLMQKDVSVSTGARPLEFFQYEGTGTWVR